MNQGITLALFQLTRLAIHMCANLDVTVSTYACTFFITYPDGSSDQLILPCPTRKALKNKYNAKEPVPQRILGIGVNGNISDYCDTRTSRTGMQPDFRESPTQIQSGHNSRNV